MICCRGASLQRDLWNPTKHRKCLSPLDWAGGKAAGIFRTWVPPESFLVRNVIYRGESLPHRLQRVQRKCRFSHLVSVWLSSQNETRMWISERVNLFGMKPGFPSGCCGVERIVHCNSSTHNIRRPLHGSQDVCWCSELSCGVQQLTVWTGMHMWKQLPEHSACILVLCEWIYFKQAFQTLNS